MDRKKFPELAFLLEKVEGRFNKRLATPKDFELLADEIEFASSPKAKISASTLRRIWGYDSYESNPTISKLDILALYAGYENFRRFAEYLKTDKTFTSGFLSTDFVESGELESGDHVLLGWNPNRVVELEYLGSNRYRVLSNRNSKLQEGDEFQSVSFIKGYPLYISHIEREGAKTSMYAAGVKDGLTLVRRISGSRPL